MGFDFSETGSWTWNTSLNRPVLKDITAIYEIVIKENPLNGTAYANRPATFYADAMNGVGTLLYQWQRSDDNGKTWKNVLIGGNEKKLELNARYSWNGNLVRCMVTDNGGNVTYTKSALLNVVDMDFNANVAASVWGNEDNGDGSGREAAFDYLMSLVKEDANQNKYFLSLTYIGCGENGQGGSYTPNAARTYNADFVVLMARLANDPVFGKEAKAAMFDVMDTLIGIAEESVLKGNTEFTAHYLSALVATADATNSASLKASYLEKAEAAFQIILQANAKDGTYSDRGTYATPQATGNADVTATAT